MDTIKEYIFNWDAHLVTFWVPGIVALILLILTIEQFAKERNIRMGILFAFLTLCCIGYIACGGSIITKMASLW